MQGNPEVRTMFGFIVKAVVGCIIVDLAKERMFEYGIAIGKLYATEDAETKYGLSSTTLSKVEMEANLLRHQMGGRK